MSITASKKLKITRQALGLCPECGDINDRLPKYMCTTCLNHHNENAKVYREKLKKEGICPHCRTPLIDNKPCPVCAERSKNSGRRIIKKRKEQGLCIRCGGIKDDPTKAQCESCLEEDRVYNLKLRKKLTTENRCHICKKPLDREGFLCSKCLDKHQARQKDYRAQRKEQGLCPYCGNPNDNLPRLRCKKCIEKQREYNRTHNQKKREND